MLVYQMLLLIERKKIACFVSKYNASQQSLIQVAGRFDSLYDLNKLFFASLVLSLVV